MPYSLSYFDDVRIDIQNAKAWYKQRRPGLEKRFAEAIKTALLKLKQNPLAHELKYKNIRVAHPKTFPYGIHFYIDDTQQQIVVVAIVHHRRNPNTSQKR